MTPGSLRPSGFAACDAKAVCSKAWRSRRVFRCCEFTSRSLIDSASQAARNCRDTGPFVLAANHCSHLDALVLGAALKPRHRERAFPIAAGDVFFQTTAVSVFSAIMLNALPMWRKNCGPHALAELRRKLQEEKAIFIIFPEGGRTRTGSMMPFKHGLGMLVAETNVPVVPCGLIGTFEALPANRKIPRPVRIKLIIGDRALICHQQRTIALAGHKSRRASNPASAAWLRNELNGQGHRSAVSASGRAGSPLHAASLRPCRPRTGVTRPTCARLPRIAPAFAPDQGERARRSEHRCRRIGVRGRDRPYGSPRSTRFPSRESETVSAIAMS